MRDPESELQVLVFHSGHTDEDELSCNQSLALRAMTTLPGFYRLLLGLQTLKALEPYTWQVFPYSKRWYLALSLLIN